MAYSQLNAYKIMWLFVFFDLPTNTKTERKRASRFRKELLKDGFSMMQFSVYNRHCASKESLELHERRVRLFIPPEGHVSMMAITDKQYSNIINFWGEKSKPVPKAPAQLEMF